jgi:hypothetical protein
MSMDQPLVVQRMREIADLGVLESSADGEHS